MNLHKYILLLFSSLALFLNIAKSQIVKHIKIEPSYVVIQGIESEIKVTAYDSVGKVVDFNCFTSVFINGKKTDIYFDKGVAKFNYIFSEVSELVIPCENISISETIKPIPLWLSILPPLIAILFALLFKEVYTALFLGIFSGTFIISLYSGIGFFRAFFDAIFSIFDTYLVRALNDYSHVSIIIFSMLIGATVNVITRNGGMQGIINYLTKFANTPRSGQFITWLLGIFIFFDDYANTLVVGNTIRPVTDKLRISREKLAYIVDSTAAPVASIAFVTTWIGAELSYIQSALTVIDLDISPYNIFFLSLKYCFYPIITLIFVLAIILLRRDFGPMYKSELRAITKGISAPVNDKKIEQDLKEYDLNTFKPKAINAIIPVMIIVLGTIAGLFITGWDSKVYNDGSINFFTKMSYFVGNSDSYISLIRASGLGLLVAVIITVSQKIMNLRETAESILSGFKTMLTAIIILCLAWALANLISDLHTADFIIQIIKNTELKPSYLPILSFLVSAIISFSTGTSWGTMAIMYPLILPATWFLCNESGMSFKESVEVFAHVSATVISGSVFGDHCSPISDTTILSSLSSSCNHIQHVRTQIPYAIFSALISMFFGTFLVENGLNICIAYIIMISVVVGFIFFIGKSTDLQMNNFNKKLDNL